MKLNNQIKIVLILPENQAGNVARFHHFLLGALVPLLEAEHTTWGNAKDQFLFPCYETQVDHIKSLCIQNLIITSAMEFESEGPMPTGGRRPIWREECRNNERVIKLAGRDVPRRYSKSVFQSCSERCRELWGRQYSTALKWATNKFSQCRSRVLFVERIPADGDLAVRPEQTNKNKSGSHRRVIQNHQELVAIASEEFGGCLSISLDSLPLTHQAALFASADVIIAQHGAALANLIWARSDSVLVEIFPDQLARRKDYFGALARCLSIKYFRIRQDEQKGPVDPADFRAVIRDVAAALQKNKSMYRLHAYPKALLKSAEYVLSNMCQKLAKAKTSTQTMQQNRGVNTSKQKKFARVSSPSQYGIKAYSQYGEDIYLIINGLINKFSSTGIVVEVGAFDGLKYSNSKLFEEYFGFKSILIEPSESFRKIPINRPNASWHHCAAAERFGVEAFAGSSAVAGMTKHMPASYRDRWNVNAMKQYNILTIPLDSIVEIEQLQYIDFLSIDVQGSELDVLRGFSFSVPVGIVCIEMEDHDLQKNQQCRDILSQNGMRLYGSVHVSEFWVSENYFRSSEISDKYSNAYSIDW